MADRRLIYAALGAVLIVLSVLMWSWGRNAEDIVHTEPESVDTEMDARWALIEGGGAPPENESAALTRIERDRRARREARRARWLERWRRSVDIAPRGPGGAGFGALDLREALAPGRDALRDCVAEAGGWGALRRARAERGGQRGVVRFDVGANGRVEPESIVFDPPMPEDFEGCFRSYYQSAELENVGEDGASVELPLGRRGRRNDGGDGGVGRGGPRGPRGEGRGDWADHRERRERRDGRPTGEAAETP